MPVRSGSGSGGQREDDDDSQYSGTPQPSSHRRLPQPASAPTGEIATDPAALAQLLPLMERRLMASLLSRRGVDRDTAREACQHAFAVFLDKRPSVDTAEHAFSWLNIVAHRQVTKWQRRHRWETNAELPDAPLSDVAESVEPRLFLEAAVEAFSRLRPKDRAVLRAAAEGQQRGASRAEQNRIALHVHRARQRLRAKMQEWWALLPWSKWRRTSLEAPVVWSPALGLNVFAALVIGGVALLPPPSTPNRVSTSSTVAAPVPMPMPTVDTAPHRAPQAGQMAARSSSSSGRADRTDPAPGLSPAPSAEVRPLALDNQRVEVDSPVTYGPVEVATRPRRPGDDALTCWGNLPVVPDGCIAHPLRQKP
jgi:DNA-directed RNA polymerase specialized sigma24 family protein